MARIAGVNIPDKKHTVIALRAIYGIGATRAKAICAGANVDPTIQVRNLTEGQLDAIRAEAPHLEPDDQTPEGGLLDRVLGR